jgi:hypothetical protein
MQQKYLRRLIAGEIQQQVRLEDTMSAYQAQLTRIMNDIVDEAELIRNLEIEAAIFPEVPADKAEQIRVAKQRMDRHLGLKNDYTRIINELKQRNAEMFGDLQAHTIELAALEFDAGGFIAHVFGLRNDVRFDEATKVVTMLPKGSVAVPIAVDLQSWKDSSQMAISKREG